MFPNFLISYVLSLLTTCEATNNHALFHLRQKGNLLNHQKVSKYYEHDCVQHFLLPFMSLLTDVIVKNNILVVIYFIIP